MNYEPKVFYKPVECSLLCVKSLVTEQQKYEEEKFSFL